MANPLTKRPAQLLSNVPECSGWDKVPAAKRKKAELWAPLVRVLCAKAAAERSSISGVVDWLLAVHDSSLPQRLKDECSKLGRKGKPPSRATLIAKCGAFKKYGIMGLVPKHKGSAPTNHGWEARAMHYWQKPCGASYQLVTDWLIEDGHGQNADGTNDHAATYDRVRNYLKSLPADLQMRGRVGPKLFTNTQRTFVRRHTDNLAPGDVYQGDGNTLDIYMQHPSRGATKPWRAELTLWIDVASRHVVGWYVSEAESANSTLFALSHAIMGQGHLPAMLHIDNGSGYKNKMMSAESTGFYDRLGITIMHSLPYNAKGKGHVERFFGTMQRSFLKRFDSYCGADMDEEAKQLVLKEYKAGERELPTIAEFTEKFTAWLEVYHNKVHRGLNGKTPAQVYADREPFPLEDHSQAIFWPRVERTVRRSCIALPGREYGAPELLHYNTTGVLVEYSLHDDSFVRVLDAKERFICDAFLIQKKAYLPTSRIVEAKDKRKTDALKRIALHVDEQKRRANLTTTHDQQLADPTLAASMAPLPAGSDDNAPGLPHKPSESITTIDAAGVSLSEILSYDDEQ